MAQYAIGKLMREQKTLLESRGRLQGIFANRYTAAVEIQHWTLAAGESHKRSQSGWGSLYLVDEGSLTLHLETVGSVRVTAGGLAAVPSGRAHVCSSPVTTRALVIRVSNNAHLLPGLLPPVLHLGVRDIAAIKGLGKVLDLLRSMQADPDPISELIKCRLADVLALSMMMQLLQQLDAPIEVLLEESFDGRIRAAIAAIHRDPSQPWSVASLAREVNLSRSSFASRFRHVVGEPPMQYLARIRVNLASSYLQSRDWSVADIAHMVGYRSEGAFINAFRRAMNISPGKFRQRARSNG